MTSADTVAIVLWLAVTLYVVFGGADFGTGFWDLAAGGSERGARPRALIDHAIGPVWEANHVWLIFCLVVLWTGFPPAFAAVTSTMFVPLTLAAIGIVFRGAGFAFRRVSRDLVGRRIFGRVFAVSSIVTPLFLGAVLGGIASGRVPASGEGDRVGSWLNPTSAMTGVLSVAMCAYLAAVFLTVDARRLRAPDLELYFRARAIGAAVFAGAAAIAGVLVLRADAPALYGGLTHEGLPFVAGSVACGSVALALLIRGGRRSAQVLAAGAVASVVWGWGIAQYPQLLPGALSISGGAGSSVTLAWLLAVAAVAMAVVGPSLALLFVLDQRNRLDETRT